MRHVATRLSAYRACGFVCLLWMCLIVTAANALSEGPEDAGDGFADGDVLKITAYGREDLTGQYIVQPGPVLSLPLIGTVQLAGRSARQLETDLSTAWENRLGSPMSVTVEFSQRAPFYVIGAVKTPGAYPYRSGMTVLQAVAVSGGILTPQAPGDSVRIDLIREAERRMQAVEKLARAQARQARLIAERDGKDQIDLQSPTPLVTKERMDGMLQEEARLLDSRTKQYAIKQTLLSDQIRLGEAEIASYQKQLKDMEDQQAQLSKEAVRNRRVPGQQVRVFELEQRATTLETTMASISASVSRTKVEVETARNSIADMQEARQREITEALLDASQAIRENELTIAAAQDALAAGTAAEPGPALTFRLMRNGKDDVKDVVSTTVLRAGDLLDVGLAAQPATQSALQSAQ